MKKLLNKIIKLTAIACLITNFIPVHAEEMSGIEMSANSISVNSNTFQTLIENGNIPREVLDYIIETQRTYPDAEITITSDLLPSGEASPNINYTNLRTYGGCQLADWVVHVSTAHNMQNILTGSSAGGFAQYLAYYLGSSFIFQKVPFASAAMTAAEYILNTNAYTAKAGDKLNAAPAYSTYTKYTYVKWNGNWTLGVQSFNATVTTISWYLYLQSKGTQYTATRSYNQNLKSSHYNSPDSAAVQNYQSGGIIDTKPKIKIGSVYFNLY